MKKKRIVIEVDIRLFQHLEALKKSQEIVLGRSVSMTELVRKLLAERTEYGEFEISIKTNDKITSELLKGGTCLNKR